MKQNTHLLPLTASALLIMVLAGCYGRDRGEGVRSVEWYVTHDAERAEQLNECMLNKVLDATPDCINASQAENIAKPSTKLATDPEDIRTAPPPVPYP